MADVGGPADGDVGETISRELIRIHEESYGVGAHGIKTYVLEGLVLSVIDIELSLAERTLLEHGHADAVKEARQAYQQAIGPAFKAVVERATGHRVEAFLSDLSIEPLFATELFRLAPQAHGQGPGRAP